MYISDVPSQCFDLDPGGFKESISGVFAHLWCLLQHCCPFQRPTASDVQVEFDRVIVEY